MGERELPRGGRGAAAAHYAKEHDVSLAEASRRFGVSRELVRQKWRDLFGATPTPTQTVRDKRTQQIATLAQHGLTMTEVAHELAITPATVCRARDRHAFAMVRGVDKVAVTDETKDKILEMAAAGKSRAEIAHETGVSYGAVNKWLRGRATRGKRSTRGASRQASETMDRTNCSLNEAAAMFVVSPPALFAYRKHRGLWTTR